MKHQSNDNLIIVINKTRLEQLVLRFNTSAQAKFYIEHSGGDFADYQSEHDVFKRALENIVKQIQSSIKYKIVEREYLPNFVFSNNDTIIVLGQDGLVANTAKYAQNRPIIAINPDPSRYDGILLPFRTDDFFENLELTINGNSNILPVTMAETTTNDGQRLLAFNDFFIGPASHTSARYRITHNNNSENQSSSGIIVSTGAGSTGWLSSIYNMTNGLNNQQTKALTKKSQTTTLQWSENKLIFVVREPFRSKHSGIELISGTITPQQKLTIESFMPANGVIFSDGIEKDFIQFNSGTITEIGIAKQKAMIVTHRKISKLSKKGC